MGQNIEFNDHVFIEQNRVVNAVRMYTVAVQDLESAGEDYPELSDYDSVQEYTREQNKSNKDILMAIKFGKSALVQLQKEYIKLVSQCNKLLPKTTPHAEKAAKKGKK